MVPGVKLSCLPVRSTASTPFVTERFAGFTLEMKFEAEIVLFAIVILLPGVKVSCLPERSTLKTLRLDIERGLCGVNVWPTLNTPLLETARGGSTDWTKPVPPELEITPFEIVMLLPACNVVCSPVTVKFPFVTERFWPTLEM